MRRKDVEGQKEKGTRRHLMAISLFGVQTQKGQVRWSELVVAYCNLLYARLRLDCNVYVHTHIILLTPFHHGVHALLLHDVTGRFAVLSRLLHDGKIRDPEST
jgi:hypothetical protein